VTQVVWAPHAIQDVEAIRAHVARDSAHYADLVVERIVAAVERLKDNPRSGRVVPELATSRSARSSTVITGSSTAYARSSSRSRPCFTVLGSSD
jgi:plasmid stabilization system protein ParE